MTNTRISDPSAPVAERPSGGQELARRATTSFGWLARPLAGRRWFRLWGILHHVGRASGRAYATPLVTRRIRDGFVIPLPFGDRTQWVRNLQAAGHATIRWDGRDFAVAEPTIVEFDDVADAFGAVNRAVLRRSGLHLVRVRDAAPLA